MKHGYALIPTNTTHVTSNPRLAYHFNPSETRQIHTKQTQITPSKTPQQTRVSDLDKQSTTKKGMKKGRRSIGVAGSLHGDDESQLSSSSLLSPHHTPLSSFPTHELASLPHQHYHGFFDEAHVSRNLFPFGSLNSISHMSSHLRIYPLHPIFHYRTEQFLQVIQP
ncbi:hypothetical protein BLNAU_464 [Blattamonas nauphoetae]|uniref:Uncharacterized protein n=1 Tax=Blattamonas nauphoetae TaxID=2049346 RepID=A0ABQ9YLB6_9EUKA|nr:hypothetical protein BLNAU_464 [Blattamonas nauphoetae]